MQLNMSSVGSTKTSTRKTTTT